METEPEPAETDLEYHRQHFSLSPNWLPGKHDWLRVANGYTESKVRFFRILWIYIYIHIYIKN